MIFRVEKIQYSEVSRSSLAFQTEYKQNLRNLRSVLEHESTVHISL